MLFLSVGSRLLRVADGLQSASKDIKAIFADNGDKKDNGISLPALIAILNHVATPAQLALAL